MCIWICIRLIILQDGDTLFSFELIGVHGTLVCDLHSSVPEHGVHESGFAMIDVSNDSDVTSALDCLLLIAG